MSAPFPLDFEGIQKPWIEDLIAYGLRYNVEPTDLKKGIEIMRRAISNGDLWTALNALTVLIGNGQSPPHYISPIPSEAVPVIMYVIGSEGVRQAGCHVRGNAETYAIVIGYCYRINGEMKNCAMIGWKLHWYSSVKLFFTEPMSPHELSLISKYIEINNRGESVGNAGGVHTEEESYVEAEEGSEYEAIPEGLEGLDLDEG